MQGRLACAALCLLLLLVPAAAAWADDDFAQAKPLPLGITDTTVSNTAATIQADESLTVIGPATSNACDPPGDAYSRATATMWWVLTGTGRPVTVTTAGSNFDTHLGIFDGGLNGVVSCQDGEPTETVTFNTAAGRPYRIQIGGCGENPNGCGPATGQINVRADSPPPGNDLRGAAAPLPTGHAVGGDNYAAGEEGGEATMCGAQRYGRTVWYRWTAPANGSVTLSVSNPDASVALYTANGTPLGCEATHGAAARLALSVTKGDHLVQVGGADSAQGTFAVQAAFAEDPDRDKDGVVNARDCKPDDARARPGARDVPNNGLDEDCSGRDARYLSISSRARLRVDLFARFSRITSLVALDVPAGAKVQVRCSGRSCPFRTTRARTIRRRAASVSLITPALRRARIVPTTTFEVRVTRANRIGRVVRFRFSRLGRRPTTSTLCLTPGSSTPRRCTA
jgi:hypothetical protein